MILFIRIKQLQLINDLHPSVKDKPDIEAEPNIIGTNNRNTKAHRLLYMSPYLDDVTSLVKVHKGNFHDAESW